MFVDEMFLEVIDSEAYKKMKMLIKGENIAIVRGLT